MTTQAEIQTLFDNLSNELRRGALVLAVLSQLRTEQYGYSLKQSMADGGMEVNEGTLYPLLRRLEKQGLLQSDWRVVNDKRPRRYYVISPAGQAVLSTLTDDWYTLTRNMDRMLITKTKVKN